MDRLTGGAPFRPILLSVAAFVVAAVAVSAVVLPDRLAGLPASYSSALGVSTSDPQDTDASTPAPPAPPEQQAAPAQPARSAPAALPAPDRHVAAGGVLSFERPHDFGLAVHPDQVLVRRYIPPCEPGFDYCLYYMGSEYAGTNFESAGLRIQRREDLAGETACLATPPAGYVDMRPQVRRGDGYAVGTFEPVGDAAMGHYAEGKVFRLALAAACYEFETRIGQSRFELHEPGRIKEFTRADQEAMEARLHGVLAAVRLVDRPGVAVF